MKNKLLGGNINSNLTALQNPTKMKERVPARKETEVTHDPAIQPQLIQPSVVSLLAWFSLKKYGPEITFKTQTKDLGPNRNNLCEEA